MNKNNIFDQIQIFNKYLKWKLYKFDNWPNKNIKLNFQYICSFNLKKSYHFRNAKAASKRPGVFNIFAQVSKSFEFYTITQMKQNYL